VNHKVLMWLAGDDTGQSSKAIVSWDVQHPNGDEQCAGATLNEQSRRTVAADASKYVSNTNSARLAPKRTMGQAGATGAGSIGSSDRASIRHSQRTRLEGSDGKELEESAQLAQRSKIESERLADESNLGGIVFNGLPSRLVRQARTQRFSAPLGMRPYWFEPDRITDDKYDWKARVQAIGNAVCVPLVYTFALQIKQALEAQDRSDG